MIKKNETEKELDPSLIVHAQQSSVSHLTGME